MAKQKLAVFFFFLWAVMAAQDDKTTIIATDVTNFWNAYDKITATTDSVKQYDILQKMYFDKGTEGLKNIMQARRYTAKDYIKAINNYPEFWKSIRKNTFKTKKLASEIEHDIARLKAAYPDLRPVPVYFTIGAFRTNGTILDNTVLIGSEMALADKATVISELPENLHYFYKTFTPIKEIGLLCTHEYVHTQQKTLTGSLLYYCLYEGVAEFVSTKVTGKPAATPAIAFGKKHEKAVREQFEKEMQVMDNTYNWIWGINQNDLKERDLGYYIGYAICERYYEMAADKKQALKEMIELDYTHEKEVAAFVDKTKFFSRTLAQMETDYDNARPQVVSVTPFSDGSKNVSPGPVRITLHFSEVMHKNFRGFDFGPLGEEHVLRVANVIGFSEDGKSFTFEADLKPGKHYQSYATSRFRTVDGIRLKPYLIDIQTAE